MTKMRPMCLLLAAALLFAACTSAGPAQQPFPAQPLPQPPAAAVPAKAIYDPGARRFLHFSQMDYERPDTVAILDRMDTLIAAIRPSMPAGEAVGLIVQMDALYDCVDTMYSLLELREGDLQTERELRWLGQALDTVIDRYDDFALALRRAGLEEEVARLHPRFFIEWPDSSCTNAQYSLYEQEAALIAKIENILSNETVSFGGKPLALDDIHSISDNTEWEQTLEVWYGAHYGPLLDLYVELVKTRTELARSYGFSNYAEMIFHEALRDYTPDMARAFIGELLDTFVPRIDALTEGGYYLPEFSLPLDALMDEAEPILGSISASFSASFRMLKEYGLYYVNPEEENLGEQIYLGLYNLPFIHVSYDGGAEAMTTFLHEFGHFYEADRNGRYGAWSHDVAEIHSQAMELLFSNHYGTLSPAYGAWLQYDLLLDCLTAIIDQSYAPALELEFYMLDLEEMTAARFDQIACDMTEWFGTAYQYEPAAWDWIEMENLLYDPFHTLCYSISMVTAFEVWELSLTDEAAALSAYEALVDCRANGTLEATRAAGLSSPFTAGRLGHILDLTEARLADLEINGILTPGEEKEWCDPAA